MRMFAIQVYHPGFVTRYVSAAAYAKNDGVITCKINGMEWISLEDEPLRQPLAQFFSEQEAEEIAAAFREACRINGKKGYEFLVCRSHTKTVTTWESITKPGRRKVKK